MNRTLSAVALTTALLALSWTAEVGGAGANSRTVACGTVHVDAYGTTMGGKFDARGVSCRKARVVVRYALTHHIGNAPRGPRGWLCARGASPEVDPIALECLRKTARVRLLND